MILGWNGWSIMATKSFITEFSINKKNAGKMAKALQQSKTVSLRMDQRVTDIKKDQVKAFFSKDK